jgi:hypothetical protein
MIKLGPMKIGIRKPRSYQSHIEWGDTFVSYWPGLEQWETVQRARRTDEIRDRITRLLFSEARSPELSAQLLEPYLNRQLRGRDIHTVIVDEVD